MSDVMIIGGGPAGLMAAEAASASGCSVTVVEAKPSLARKFLMAGKSGLNITRAQEFKSVLAAYPEGRVRLEPILRQFGPDDIMDWVRGLGRDCFIGSTGHVFPTEMKASPLLRAWIARLKAQKVTFRTRWRWCGWQGEELLFEHPDGHSALSAHAVVFALGGGSWARLGSDGQWRDCFATAGLPTTRFEASNIGLHMAWSDRAGFYAGHPLKAIALMAGQMRSRGEVVITAKGLEGGGLYPLAPALRMERPLVLDLLPDMTSADIAAKLARPRGKTSLSNHIRKTLRLSELKRALLTEVTRPLPSEPGALARLIKSCPLPSYRLAPLDEAISTAGGLNWEGLDDHLMLRAKPGTFCAGEMIAWDAPTGGYLLTACLATGKYAGLTAARWAKAQLSAASAR